MSHLPTPRLSILSACVGMTLLVAAADLAAQGTSSGSTTAGTTAAAGSNTGSAAGANAGAAMSAADKSFAQKAAVGGLAEVEMGKLAQQKAASDQVKQFGSRMVDDHSKANDELKQIASTKGITLPTDLDAKHKSKIDKMQKLSGAAFDKAYMDDMVADHKQDVAEFQKEASSGRDSDLKGFASKTLPTLQDHLKMAQTTQAAVKGGKTSASAHRTSGSGG